MDLLANSVELESSKAYAEVHPSIAKTYLRQSQPPTTDTDNPKRDKELTSQHSLSVVASRRSTECVMLGEGSVTL